MVLLQLWLMNVSDSNNDSRLSKQQKLAYSTRVSISAWTLLLFVTSSFVPIDVKRIISTRDSSNQTHSWKCVGEDMYVCVWLFGWRETVACVVNSRYFQQSLTRRKLKLCLDPFWVILDCVVCMWVIMIEVIRQRQEQLYSSSREQPDCNFTILACASQLCARIDTYAVWQAIIMFINYVNCM